MSSTSNSQNLLVNVFRPTYVYDADKGYIPKLVVSNVDSVVGTSGTFSNLNVGDVKSNVYIGINAGNPNSAVESCNSTGITAIGLSAGSNNSNCDGSVFMGNSTGSNTSNVDNSVYLGALTGSYNSNCANSVYIGFNSAKNLCNASNEVAIGTNTIAGGTSNIYIGASTGSTGSSNIFIGPNIAPGAVSNQLRVGAGSNIAIYGDLANQKLGINTIPTVGFDVSGEAFFNNKVGIQMAPTHSLDVAGQIYATNGILIGAGSAAAPSIALEAEQNTGIFADSNVSEGRSFGFSIRGNKKLTMTDTSINVFGDLFIQGTFSASASTLPSNTVLGGYIRAPDFTGTKLDISAGGIRVTDRVFVGGETIKIGSGYITDTCTNGYIRMLNDSEVTQIDLSGGNISNTATTRSSNFIGTASASNQIGGVTLNNGVISNANTTSNNIGGIVINSSNISNVSTIITTASTSNQVGGVTLNNGVISNANATNNNIGGVILSNNRIGIGVTTPTYALDICSATFPQIFIRNTDSGPTAEANITISGSSNSVTNGLKVIHNSSVQGLYALNTIPMRFFTNGVERVTLWSNGNFGIGTLSPNYLLDVNGTAYINGALTLGSTISNGNTTSNNIGGIVINSSNISNVANFNYSGIITGSTANTCNVIGGVVLNNSNVSNVANFNYSGTITGSTANTCNVIGGVVLNNSNVSNVANFNYSGTITGSTANTSNVIGGVVLSNSNVSNVNSIITTSTTSNQVGGVTLNNGAISNVGTTSNSIGGVVVTGGTIRSISNCDTFTVALGEGTNTIATSTDGITWTGRGTSIFSTEGRNVAWNGSIWVGVGSGTNTIAWSADGITWTGLGTSIFSSAGNGVAWNGSLWVAVGSGTNTIATSTDGITWTGRGTSTFTTAGRNVAWNGSMWVVVGEGTNTIAYSLNGTTWTPVSSPPLTSFGWSLAWNGSLWVAVGGGTNTIATSVDGIAWTGRGISALTTFGIGVAWNGSLWVAVGSGTNSIVTSTDGITWTGRGATIFTFQGLNVTWNGSIWIAVGDGTNSIATSTDGITWTGRGTSIFSTRARGIAGRRYVLPIIDANTFDVSGITGNVEITGSLIGANTMSSNRIGGATFYNGNVGIGTTAPGQKLVVIDTSGGFFYTAPSTVGHNRFKSTGVNLATSRDLMIDTTNDTARPTMYLTTSGRVGIGTSNPQSQLDISGSGTQSITITSSTSGNTQPLLIFNDGTGQGLYSSNSLPMTFSTGGGERMRILAAGNVGINCNVPAYRLDVAGVANVSSNYRVGLSNFIYRSNPIKNGSTYGVNWQTALATTNAACLISYTVDSTTDGGDSFTVASNGLYSITFSAQGGTFWALDSNLAAGSIPSISSNKVNLIAWTGAFTNETGGSFTVWLTTGATYRLKANGVITNDANYKLFIAPIYATP